MDKDIEYTKVHQLIENDSYDEAYTYIKEIGKTFIDIKKYGAILKDNILASKSYRVEKDPCDDDKYTVTEVPQYGGGGGDDNCCDCCYGLVGLAIPVGLGMWCCNNPDSCAETTVDCCCGCCCGC